jgi:hypothetical protein
MLFGTGAGLELGLLLLYYIEVRRSDMVFGVELGVELGLVLPYYR